MSKVRGVQNGVAAGAVEAPRARVLPALVVVGLLVFVASCATQMRVQSDPPGAEVTCQRQSHGPTPNDSCQAGAWSAMECGSDQ